MPDIVCPLCRDGVVFVRTPDEVPGVSAEVVAEECAQHLNGEGVAVFRHAAGYARHGAGYVVNGLWGHGGRSHRDFTLAEAWPDRLVPLSPEQADVLQCPGCRRWHPRSRLRSTRCDACLAKEAEAREQAAREAAARAEAADRPRAQAEAERGPAAGGQRGGGTGGATTLVTRPTRTPPAPNTPAFAGPGAAAHPVPKPTPSLLGDLAAGVGSLFYVGFSLCAGQLVVGVPLLIVAAWAWTRHRRGEELGDDLRLALVGLGLLYAMAMVVPFV